MESTCFHHNTESSAAAEDHEDYISSLHAASIQYTEKSKESSCGNFGFINCVISSINGYVSNSSIDVHFLIIVGSGWNDP